MSNHLSPCFIEEEPSCSNNSSLLLERQSFEQEVISYDSYSSEKLFSYSQDGLNSLEKSYEDFLFEFNSLDEGTLLDTYSKCNKSNIVKNILYQFQDFINVSGDHIVIESISEQQGDRSITQIRKEFHNFTKKKKLNQTFLVSVLKSKRFCSLFAYFLNYYASEWVQNGNIKNVKDHVLCIVYLQRCNQDVDLVDKIVKYKKRN